MDEILGDEAGRMDENGEPLTLLRGLDSRYHVNCGSGMRGPKDSCLSD